MIQKIAIIGGDLRNVELAKMYAKDGYDIKMYGFDNFEELEKYSKIIKCDTLENTINDCNIIIGPIPFSKDNLNLNFSYSDKKLDIFYFLSKIKNKKIIAGIINEKISKLMQENNVTFFDLMKKEKLVIQNTIATAEGTIKIAIEETDKNIFKSNILILGFGRVGKTLANRFKALGAKIYCEARKEEDLAWINTLGYNEVSLDKLDQNLSKMDILINTVPTMIVKEEQIKKLKKDCVIIDLSSMPGGIDDKSAKENKIKTIHALGLPGKIAPYTSARYIKEIIDEILK